MNHSSHVVPAELTVNRLAASYQGGQVMQVEMTLQVRDICIFDPVLRLFIRHRGSETHLLSSDTHQGAIYLPWLPQGEFSFSFRWPVSLPAGDYEVGISWGTVSQLRPPDFVLPMSIEGTAPAQRYCWEPGASTRTRNPGWQNCPGAKA